MQVGELPNLTNRNEEGGKEKQHSGATTGRETPGLRRLHGPGWGCGTVGGRKLEPASVAIGLEGKAPTKCQDVFRFPLLEQGCSSSTFVYLIRGHGECGRARVWN
jgi:hypothetical protein